MATVSETEYEYSRIKKQPKKKIKVRSFRGFISVFLALILSASALLMLIMGLYLRIELTKQNDINVKLEQTLNALSEENRRLSIRYESAIDLTELEDYARNELGMQKPGINQKKTIDTETQDKAVILSDAAKADLADKIGDLISIISDALL